MFLHANKKERQFPSALNQTERTYARTNFNHRTETSL
jgi:hypothetical protein